MAVAFKAVLGEVGNVTSGTTLVLTTTAAIDVGDFVIVRASADNLSATTPTFTCSDSGGNTYTTHRQGAIQATAAAGVAGAIMATVATNAVASGGTITVTLSGAVVSKSMFARSFTGVLNTLRNAAVSATGTSTAAAVTSGSATIGDLVCGAVAAETRATPTGDSDTTGGAWQAMEFTPSATGGSDASRTIVTGQYKIATAAGTQTYNNTTANTDWVALICVFQFAPDPAISLAAYQWFGEGTEAGAASLAAQNTAVNGDINNGDATGTLRVRLQSTTAVAVPASDDWQLQRQMTRTGLPGGWVDITPASAAVQTYDSPNLTGTGATTNRLTGGTGGFTAGEVSEDGTANDKGWPGNGFTEFVYALKIVAANVLAGDILDFRILRNGATATMTYGVTPQINIIRSAVDHAATISSDWGTWTGTADGSVTTPVVDRPGTISSSWGTWTTIAAGTVVAEEILATISTNWSGAPSIDSITGKVVLFEADDASTFSFSSSTLVQQWRDKSGGAKHLSQSTPGDQPDRSGTRNGLTTVKFDHDYMAATTAADWKFLHDGSPYSIYIAFKLGSGTNTYHGLMGTTGTATHGPGFDVLSINASHDIRHAVSGSSDANAVLNTSAASWLTVDTWVIVSIRADPDHATPASRSTIQVTGGPNEAVLTNNTASGAVLTSNPPAPLTLGTRSPADNGLTWMPTGSEVGAVLILDHQATTPEDTQIKGYLAKWTTGTGGTAGGWTAVGTVSGPAITDHPGTIASAWGTWTATAAGTVVAEVITGTITTTWGAWTATAAGTVVAEVITATIISAWGTWTATSTAIRQAYAGITTSWGPWTGSAAGSVGTPAGWSIPPNVVATTTGPSTITVTWDDVPAATGYDIERNAVIIVYNHPDSPYNDSGLNSDTLYSYRVRAVG